MFRITRTALLTTLAFGASLSGCAENESSLFIEGVLAIAATDCAGSVKDGAISAAALVNDGRPSVGVWP